MSASRSRRRRRHARRLRKTRLRPIEVDIEPLPPLPDRHAAAKDQSLLFEDTGSNRAVRYSVSCGDADAAFAEADYRRRESFRCHRLTALPLETRGLIAEWDAAKSRLTVFGATKVLFFNRRMLAPMLGIAESAIDMIELDVGGGFGVRGEFYPEDFLIPFAARHVGRPVKWIEDRREHLMATNHSREVDCELEIACTQDGVILGHARAMFMATWGPISAPMAESYRPKRRSSCRAPTASAISPLTVEALMTSKTPVGTLRAPGRFEANFFRERLFDIVARDLGLDPMEFRRKNLITEAGAALRDRKACSLRAAKPISTPATIMPTFERALRRDRLGREEVAARPPDRRPLSRARRRAASWKAAGRARRTHGCRDRKGRHRSPFTVGLLGAWAGAGNHAGAGRRRHAEAAVSSASRFCTARPPMCARASAPLRSRSMVVGGSAVFDGCNNLLAAIRGAEAAQRFCGHFPTSEIAYLRWTASSAPRKSRKPCSVRARYHAEGSFANDDPNLQLRRSRVPCRGRPAHRPRRNPRLRRIEDVGRAINPAHRARPGDRRIWCRDWAASFSTTSSTTTTAQILNASLADYLRATRYPISPMSAPSRWSFGAPRPIRSAPRAPAKAAWSRWRRRPPMRSQQHSRRSASSCANCRCRRPGCGSWCTGTVKPKPQGTPIHDHSERKSP